MSSNYSTSRSSSNGDTKKRKSNLFGSSNRDVDSRHLAEFTTPLTENGSYIDYKNDATPDDRGYIAGWPNKWKRFELLNRGIYNGKWADQQLKRGQDDWYLCRAIGSQVGLSERLKKLLWVIFEPLNMGSFKKYERKTNSHSQSSDGDSDDASTTTFERGTIKQHLVIFSISALLYNQNKSDDIPKYYPGTESHERQRHGYPGLIGVENGEGKLKDGHELLTEFASQLRFREKDIRSCMEKLRGMSPKL